MRTANGTPAIVPAFGRIPGRQEVVPGNTLTSRR
jgi:hypothetical protein